MSRKSIVQKSKSQLNTNQNVVNRMAEKNFEIYECAYLNVHIQSLVYD